MRNKIRQICSLAALVIGLMISAQAQTATQYRAHIPFDFNVGSTTFTAGDYAIGLTNPASGQQSLTIRDLKSGEAKMFQFLPKDSDGLSEISQLVFNRYDDQYFLGEMTTPTLSAKFRKAKFESRLAKMQKPEQEKINMKR